jgi:GT2 family glycosyltransferase
LFTMSQPAAAVVIPTRNRKDLLGKAIASALAQTVPVEVFVMDDASTDATGEMVRAEFPGVTYRRSEVNIGPTGQRNRGAALAGAPFLVTLDDDCVLQSPRTIEQTIRLFDSPSIGAVTIPYVNVLQDKVVRGGVADAAGAAQGAQSTTWVTYDYLGGMIAFRRDAYKSVGGYREYLFMHVEEPDLATRLLGAGMFVRLGDADPIHHYESPTRDRPRLDVLGARNHVLYCWYHTPLLYLPVYLFATSFLCARHGFRVGHPVRVLRGLCRGFGGIIHEFAERRPLSRRAFRLARSLKSAHAMPLDEAAGKLKPIGAE